MKEFIEKLISRLEEEPISTIGVGMDYMIQGNALPKKRVIEIVSEFAEEYAKDIDAGELFGKTVNDGWIPYTDKSYPKVGRIIDVWLTLEDGVYKAVWNGSDFEWENGRVVTDKIFAWKDNSVPKPYQPKGEYKRMDFLAKLDTEVLKAELLAFLDCEDIEVDSMEDFKEKFIDYIEEDFSYGDCE